MQPNTCGTTAATRDREITAQDDRPTKFVPNEDAGGCADLVLLVVAAVVAIVRLLLLDRRALGTFFGIGRFSRMHYHLIHIFAIPAHPTLQHPDARDLFMHFLLFHALLSMGEGVEQGVVRWTDRQTSLAR